VLVKLDSPKGAHYAGGDIAAPVTQVVLRAALAARDAALDRGGLAASEKNPAMDSSSTPSQTVDRRNSSSTRRGEQISAATYDPNGNVGRVDEPPPVIVELPSALHAPPPPATMRAIPDVRGMSIRAAVRALHQAGFRVRLVDAPATYTLPTAGAMAAPGTIVQLAHSAE
jgi:hypothetical protein